MDKFEESAAKAWQAILAKVREMSASGMKQTEIGRLLGVKTRSVISAWLSGTTTSVNASYPDMMRYLYALGLNPLDFLPGANTIRRTGKFSPVEIVECEEEKVILNVYMMAGCGNPAVSEESTPVATITIPRSYARKSDFCLLVDGQSMEPTIRSGAVVGVQRNADFASGEIYALALRHEGMVVKRVRIDHETESLVVQSDNVDKDRYPSFRLPLAENRDAVVGRVVWIWQTC